MVFEMVIGPNHFNNGAASVVGVAINGDTTAATKWADKQPTGRPATVVMVRIGEAPEEAAAKMKARWEQHAKQYWPEAEFKFKPGLYFKKEAF